MWRNIKFNVLLNTGISKRSNISKITVDEVDLSDSLDISNQFNDYFVNIGRELNQASSDVR